MIPDTYTEIRGEPFIIDMMYAGLNNNMTGRAVYAEIGLGNRAFGHRDMWNVLQKAIPTLERLNLKMKICDAGRPVIAHRILTEIIPIKGFFALEPEKSQHCHGTAVDVCLCTPDGQELPYPTRVDAYEAQIAQEAQQGKTSKLAEQLKKARHDYEAPELKTEIGNRRQLKELMESIGLQSIPHEWWHYNLPGGLEYPLFDY